MPRHASRSKTNGPTAAVPSWVDTGEHGVDLIGRAVAAAASTASRTIPTGYLETAAAAGATQRALDEMRRLARPQLAATNPSPLLRDAGRRFASLCTALPQPGDGAGNNTWTPSQIINAGEVLRSALSDLIEASQPARAAHQAQQRALWGDRGASLS